VDAVGGRHRVGLARRPDRAQETADDLDRLVFGVQLHRGAFSGILVSVFVSRFARYRHGSGMAVRLAMETWPIRSRGFMAGVLQASWGLDALLSSAAYGLLYNSIGWRGLLMIGVLPMLSIVYVRRFVKEPSVWVENSRLQRVQQREVHVPVVKISTTR
jgi:MFS family permease